MKACPDAFAQQDMVGVLNGKFAAWLNEPVTRVLALHLACDLVEQLKDKSCPYWPAFMMKVFELIKDKDAEVRISANYVINLAAEVPQFSEASPEAYNLIFNQVEGKMPKKKDENAMIAIDNAVAALLSLGVHKKQQCPPGKDPFAVVLSKLPLKYDREEALKVHTKIVDLLMKQDEGLLGAGMSNLGKILSLLAEIHKDELKSDDDLDTKITQVFKSITPDVLRQNASCFSEKQQKRIEKIVSS